MIGPTGVSMPQRTDYCPDHLGVFIRNPLHLSLFGLFRPFGQKAELGIRDWYQADERLEIFIKTTVSTIVLDLICTIQHLQKMATSISDSKAGASLAELEEVEFTPPSHQQSRDEPWHARLMRLMNRVSRKTPQPQPRSTSPIPEYHPHRAKDGDAPRAPANVLYLAYGSNLCAATFQGSRGCRPLSAANVWVPALELTFDLPGIPYSEPCFANTRFRTQDAAARALPNGDTRPNGTVTERDALLAPTAVASDKTTPSATALGWDTGLIGVVYEVTPADYAHIIATEGGGSSYADVKVTCHLLPRGEPFDPAAPPADRPTFLAHTLLAKGDAVYNNRRAGWAQPSARYLGLLTTGAKEHRLPAQYEKWLAGLQPYVITSARQTVGKWLLILAFFPWIMGLFLLQRLTADGEGRAAPWVARLLKGFFGATWVGYDWFFKPVFGDGERTVER